MLNRTVAPKVSFNATINKLEYNTTKLNNNIPVYSIKDANQAVAGIEVIFQSGKAVESTNGASYFSSNMLKSGMTQFNANAINEFFDYRGAFVQIQNGLDYSSVSLYCLSEKLVETLPFFVKLFTDSSFPEDQMEKLKKKKGQEIRINLQKSSYWATKLFKESLFGTHSYGQLLTIEDVEKLDRESIAAHWNKISSRNIKLITVAGNFDLNLITDSLELINTDSNRISSVESESKIKIFNKGAHLSKQLPNSEQESLKIGLPTIGLNHKDWATLSIGNTILGGYFGSRLMQTIREEKGLTYGIRSSIIHMLEASYFQISADLKKGVGLMTMDLIKSELQILGNNKIANDELDKVKSYMIGEHRSNTESIFDRISKVKFLKIHNLPDSFFTNHFHKILETSSEEINNVIQKYLQSDNFHSILVE